MKKVREYWTEREKVKGRFVHRVNVSSLVRLSYYPTGMLWIPSHRILTEGTLWHARLGFIDIEVYRRYVEYKGELYRVSGRPDTIKNGILYELKTYATGKAKQIKIGWAQLSYYTFLTGIEEQRLVLFYRNTRRIEEFARRVSMKDAKKEVLKGLRAYSALLKIKNIS